MINFGDIYEQKERTNNTTKIGKEIQTYPSFYFLYFVNIWNLSWESGLEILYGNIT
jgi:hypothetical protein